MRNVWAVAQPDLLFHTKILTSPPTIPSTGPLRNYVCFGLVYGKLAKSFQDKLDKFSKSK